MALQLDRNKPVTEDDPGDVDLSPSTLHWIIENAVRKTTPPEMWPPPVLPLKLDHLSREEWEFIEGYRALTSVQKAKVRRLLIRLSTRQIERGLRSSKDHQ